MSSLRTNPPLSLYKANVCEQDLPFNATLLKYELAELTRCLGERIKPAAEYLGKAAVIQQRAALEAVAQAVRLPKWHQLSAHLLGTTAAVDEGRLPVAWPDVPSGAHFLLIDPRSEIAMREAQLQAHPLFNYEFEEAFLGNYSSAQVGVKTMHGVRNHDF